jgi:glycosyltransferase involved in cell wall biosynthesis
VSATAAPLDILLVGNYAPDGQQSMQRYAELVRSELTARGHTVELIRPEPFFGRLCPSPYGLGKWLGYLDKFVVFPHLLRRAAHARPGRLIHICDHSNAMYCRVLQDAPHLVTCHDLLAVESALGLHPESPIKWSGRQLQSLILRSLRTARHIICDSEATRRSLLKLSGVAAAACTTVYIGLNHPYRPLATVEAESQLASLPALSELRSTGFLFHVGGDQWYKNRAGLVRIYFEYVKLGGHLPLVMAGKPWPADLRRLIATGPTGARVVELPNVDNSTLNALYARAAALVFPSLTEGFGWPVLEALAVGCPVFCSDRGSLPEVGGDAVTYFDPTAATAAAAAQLCAFLASPATASETRRAHGYQQAARFSNAAMTDQLLATYRQLLTA